MKPLFQTWVSQFIKATGKGILTSMDWFLLLWVVGQKTSESKSE